MCIFQKPVKPRAVTSKKKGQAAIKRSSLGGTNAQLQQKYKMKYSKLRKTIKDWVFVSIIIYQLVYYIIYSIFNISYHVIYLSLPPVKGWGLSCVVVHPQPFSG